MTPQPADAVDLTPDQKEYCRGRLEEWAELDYDERADWMDSIARDVWLLANPSYNWTLLGEPVADEQGVNFAWTEKVRLLLLSTSTKASEAQQELIASCAERADGADIIFSPADPYRQMVWTLFYIEGSKSIRNAIGRPHGKRWTAIKVFVVQNRSIIEREIERAHPDVKKSGGGHWMRYPEIKAKCFKALTADEKAVYEKMAENWNYFGPPEEEKAAYDAHSSPMGCY